MLLVGSVLLINVCSYLIKHPLVIPLDESLGGLLASITQHYYLFRGHDSAAQCAASRLSRPARTNYNDPTSGTATGTAQGRGGSLERDRRTYRDRVGREEGHRNGTAGATGTDQEEGHWNGTGRATGTGQGRRKAQERSRRSYRHRVGLEESHWNGTGGATGTGQG